MAKNEQIRGTIYASLNAHAGSFTNGGKMTNESGKVKFTPSFHNVSSMHAVSAQGSLFIVNHFVSGEIEELGGK